VKTICRASIKTEGWLELHGRHWLTTSGLTLRLSLLFWGWFLQADVGFLLCHNNNNNNTNRICIARVCRMTSEFRGAKF